MSAISIETKKVTELTAFTTPTDSCLIPIHDGTGLKKITFANFRTKAVEGTEAKIAPLLFNNAGAHNAIYRGKSLGSTVTTAQYAAIKAGTFDDLYIGDYWTIGGVNYPVEKDEINTTSIILRDFDDFDVMKIEFTKTAEPYNRIVLNYFSLSDVVDFTMNRRDMTSSPKAIKQELIKEVIS